MKVVLALLGFMFLHAGISAQHVFFEPNQYGFYYDYTFGSREYISENNFGLGFVFNNGRTELHAGASNLEIERFWGDDIEINALSVGISHLLIKQDIDSMFVSFSLDANYASADLSGKYYSSTNSLGASIYRSIKITKNFGLLGVGRFISQSTYFADEEENKSLNGTLYQLGGHAFFSTEDFLIRLGYVRFYEKSEKISYIMAGFNLKINKSVD